MVLDAFLYNGEEDLLEIRLSVLDEYVDKFVLVEARESFSGLPKPAYFEENNERFSAWKHKIVHHIVDGYTDEEWAEAKASPNTGGLDHWCREYIQRENIKKGLIKAGAADEDVVFYGDVDEIWSNKVFGMGWSSFLDKMAFGLKLQVYAYWLNNLSNEEFWGSIMTRYKYLKDESLNHLKTAAVKTPHILGWHFTSMGGINELKRKIESYGHQEFNTDEIKNGLEHRLSTGQDFIGRDFRYTLDESEWPSFLKKPENRAKYKHLIKDYA